MKFLPRNLMQVNYKILWLDFLKKVFCDSLDECSKNGSFECFFGRKMALGL